MRHLVLRPRGRPSSGRRSVSAPIIGDSSQQSINHAGDDRPATPCPLPASGADGRFLLPDRLSRGTCWFMIEPFVIIGRQRSGTTLLRHALSRHPNVICHGEIFNRNGMRGLKGRARKVLPSLATLRESDPIAFLDHFLAAHDRGRVGFKLLLRQNQTVMSEIIRRQWPLIILRRQNLLARYSSHMIAKSTGQHCVRNGTTVIREQLTFNAAEFERYCRQDNNLWRSEYEDIGIPKKILDLDYCDVAFGDGLARCFEFLGLEPMEVAPCLQKLNSSDIVSRFTNPDDVLAYLARVGRMDWRTETNATAPAIDADAAA
jgi:LPS sulfotransferase NodH